MTQIKYRLQYYLYVCRRLLMYINISMDWKTKTYKKTPKYINRTILSFSFIDYQVLDVCWCIVDTIYYVESCQFQCDVHCFKKTIYLVPAIFDFLEYSLFQFSFCLIHLPWKHPICTNMAAFQHRFLCK